MAKEVDRARTLEKYIDRISRMDDEAFRVFDNAMIGTFELYSTRHNVEAGDHMIALQPPCFEKYGGEE